MSFFYLFRYEKLTVKWPDATIIASDTDSYIFNVCTPDIKKDLKDPLFANFFDFSTLDDDDPMRDKSENQKSAFGRLKRDPTNIIISWCASQVYLFNISKPKIV